MKKHINLSKYLKKYNHIHRDPMECLVTLFTNFYRKLHDLEDVY